MFEETSGEALAMYDPEPDAASVTARVRRYEAVCSTLLALAPIAGRWSGEEHVSLWQRALSRLGSTRSSSGKVIWLGLRRYPAALLLYALGIGAVEANQLGFLARLLEAPIREEHRKDKTAVEVLPPSCLFDGNRQRMQILDGMERRHVPLNDWMHDALRPHAARVVPDDTRYTFVFDKLETLMALAYTHIHSGQGLGASRGVRLPRGKPKSHCDGDHRIPVVEGRRLALRQVRHLRGHRRGLQPETRCAAEFPWKSASVVNVLRIGTAGVPT